MSDLKMGLLQMGIEIDKETLAKLDEIIDKIKDLKNELENLHIGITYK
jgi:hypothetical protein